jgi:putative ABC transport system permease protein
MSLLAILVGGFLIYNTLTFSVLQRRRLLAIKRMLGMTQRQLFGLVLSEALVLGLIGTLLGLLLGWALGQGLIRLVTRTINDLYFVLTVTEMLPTPWSFVKGATVGLAASLLAALGPATEAAGTSPVAAQRRSVLERRTHKMVRWLAASGGLAMAGGLALVQFSHHGLINGFVALFMIVVGYSLIVPLAVLGIIRMPLGPARRLFGPLGQLAARGIVAGLSRTGLTIAALTLAISATVGVAILISSFRATVADWLEQTLQSDIYVSAPGSVSSRADGSLDPLLIERLRELPDITGLSTGRRVEVNTPTDPIDVLVLDPGPQSLRGFQFKSDRPQMWRRFRAGELVLISEPLAYHRALEPPDRLRLLTDRQGYQSFEIGGVFHDYGSSRGMVLISRNQYDRYWNDPHVSSVGLQLAETVEPEQALARVRAAVAELGQTVLVRFNRVIREVSLAVFDRTFAITQVLRLLTVGVAFVGIISALMAIQLEQRRDHAVLRATGVTPGQLFALVLMQTGLMGLLAGLLALPIGWLMSELLIHVINLRAFGWSMQSLFPLPVLGEALLLSLTAALLAGLYPAYRMARVSPAAALREE